MYAAYKITSSLYSLVWFKRIYLSLECQLWTIYKRGIDIPNALMLWVMTGEPMTRCLLHKLNAGFLVFRLVKGWAYAWWDKNYQWSTRFAEKIYTTIRPLYDIECQPIY